MQGQTVGVIVVGLVETDGRMAGRWQGRRRRPGCASTPGSKMFMPMPQAYGISRQRHRGVSIPGMNLDIDLPGAPDPTPLRNLGWARMKYNVSLNRDPKAIRGVTATPMSISPSPLLPGDQKPPTRGSRDVLVFCIRRSARTGSSA
jgi:hypothetical protein